MKAHRATEITLRLARSVLGVGPDADAAEVRRAFRRQAMRLHPDRSGGDAARFREMLEAYRLIQTVMSLNPPPAPARPEPEPSANAPPAVRPEPLYRPNILIDPAEAMLGGSREISLSDGRRIVVHLPAGLRPGDLVRAGGETFKVTMRPAEDTVVRGSDLWVTARVPAAILKAGGRAALSTPLGRRIIWISKKAGERRLVRLEGQGLPARGAYAAGSLFVRLVPESEVQDSPARALLRRFAQAWAA